MSHVPTKFAHVVYRTRRFEEMLHWYATVFDAKVQHRNPVMAFMTYDDEHHRFAFVDLSVLQPDGTDRDRQGAVGIDHVAYTYGSVNALLENYADLKESGILPYWCIHHGVTASLYYADPDGNQMEFQVDCCASSEEATDYMNNKFALNPVGVEFDPEDWLAKVRAGEPIPDFPVRQVHEPIAPIRGAIVTLMSPG